MTPSVAALVVALATLPAALGAGVGVLLRRARGGRFAGLLPGLGLLVVPVLLAIAAVLWRPVIGLWDAVVEGALVGVGLTIAAHRALARRADVTLLLASVVAGLGLFEAASRLFLPPPPGFPIEGGPHLLLADAIRAGTRTHSWDLRSKELVCSIVYEDRYPGILDAAGEHDIPTPRTFVPRRDAARRVLHVGDSMTFGIGVDRGETFVAGLGHLEPAVEHVNAGIPGTAPDAYLSVLERWAAVQRIDTVVMYVFEGNDVDGLDDRYPCCSWEPLLAYDRGGARLRCPEPAPVDLHAAGATWLRYNSPPPFLVRAFIPYSSAAGHVAAAVVDAMTHMPRGVDQPTDVALSHLEAIVRSARDDLRERGVGFAVVVLPSRDWVEGAPRSEHLAPRIMDVCRALEVAAVDASAFLRDERLRGSRSFMPMPTDPHFSAAGHAALAGWLHGALAAALPPPHGPQPDEPLPSPAHRR